MQWDMLRAALDELPDASVMVFDGDLRYQLVRGGALAQQGVDPEELEGQCIADVLLPARWAFYEPMYRAALGGEPSTVFVTSPDGSHRYLVRVNPLRDDTGRILGGVSMATDVTEQAVAAEALAESEQRYRVLAENASDVVLLRDPTGTLQWASPSISSLLGWDPDELVGTDTLDLVHPEDVPLVLQVRAEVAAGGVSSGVTIRIRAGDGSFRYMSEVSRTVADGDGSSVGAAVGLRDVDDLVRARDDAESARRAAEGSRARLQAVLDAMLEPHVVVSAIREDNGTIVDFAYVDANEAACEYMSMTRDELLHVRVLGVWPGPLGLEIVAMYAGALESHEPLVLNDWAYPHQEPGSERRYDIRAVCVDDTLSFAWRDVTDRFEAARAIAESEERYRLLAENASDVVVRVQEDDIIRWVSPALTESLGWTPEEWLGQPLSDFVHPEDLARYRAGSDALRIGAPRPDHGVWVSRLRARDRADGYHWIEVHAREYLTSRADRDGVVMSFRIVDAEVHAEQELERRARFDDLTGAMNRDEALARLNEVGINHRRPGDACGILFIDVDGFKSVNDECGHAAGDVLLRALAARIRAAVRSGDTVARMGGDEFLVILEGVHDLVEATAVAEKIRLAAAEPVATPQEVVRATVSIGVTVSGPAETADRMTARADAAMYQAKQSGRDQVAILPV
jgi:diguanylate cyclase (GGDEF)-like protein/PAS domain S-box-containing protein